jgi:hypothetical protein
VNAVRTKRAHYIHGEERKPTENEPADDNRERLRGFSLHPEALHLRLNVPLAHPPRHHFGLVPVVARAGAGAWGPLDAVAAARPPRRGPPARVKPLHAELVLPPVQARRGGVLPVDGVVHGVAGLRGGAAGGDGQQVRVGRRRQVVARGVAHADLDPLVPAPRRRARTDAAGGGVVLLLPLLWGEPWWRFPDEPRPRWMRSVRRCSSKRLPKPREPASKRRYEMWRNLTVAD